MFKVGEKVVHPGGGLCTVCEISERNLHAGETRVYYILQPSAGQDVTMMVPVESAKRIGLRKTISEQEADTAIQLMREDKAQWQADRAQRAKAYGELFKDNSIEGLQKAVQTLKMLLVRNKSAKLSFEDKEMMTRLQVKVLSEIAQVKKTSFDMLISDVNQFVHAELADKITPTAS